MIVFRSFIEAPLDESKLQESRIITYFPSSSPASAGQHSKVAISLPFIFNKMNYTFSLLCNMDLFDLYCQQSTPIDHSIGVNHTLFLHNICLFDLYCK